MKKKLKSALGRVAGKTGAYARHFRSRMMIVAFHRVNDSMSVDGLTCGAEKFEAFCEFFRDHFRVVALSEQVAGCHAGADMGGTLAITFDDGYVDNFEVAAPILRKFRLPAAFFVASGYVGTKLVAPWDQSVASNSWMSWDHVRALAADGFEIGSHTHRHINLGFADEETIRADLRESKSRLLHELGRPARLFAYPFGGRADISDRSRELVREEGFECCVSCFGGSNPTTTADPYSLNRIGIADWFESPDQFGFEMLVGKI